MKRIFWLTCFLFLLNSISAQKFVVVIDPGHGGKDSGATRGKVKEKDINLAVALQLGKYIESKHSDTKVVYTRTNDVFVDLYKRPNIANKAKANLFISIHVNSTGDKTTKANGAETYIVGESRNKETLEVAKRENSVILLEDNYKTKYEGFDPKSPESYIIFEFMANKYLDQSLEFGKLVQKEIKNITKLNDRGVRQDVFWVLRKTSMPSVLIELGFINNEKDVAYMTSANGERALASSIFSAFEKYKKDFLNKQGGIYTTSEKKSEVKNQTSNTTDIKKEVDRDVAEKKETKTPPQTLQKAESANDFTKKAKKNPIASKPDDTPNTTSEKTKKEKDVKTITSNSKTNNSQESTNNIKYSTDEVEYRIQFLVTTSKLPEKSDRFKGIYPVNFYEDGGAYKYTYGSTNDFNEAQKLQRKVRASFSDAFIIKFKNGKRIK